MATSWAEKRNRFPKDELLRRSGFRLKARPEGREAIWERIADRQEFAESVALAFLDYAWKTK
jgi:hypothetical protein